MRISIRHVSFALLFVLIVPLLIACGGDATTGNPTATTTTVQPPATAVMQASPETAATPVKDVVATPVSATPQPTGFEPQSLTTDELVKIQPNELGGIPIFMYHNIVSDPALEGHLYRTADEFYADLQWLYDNNFYLVGMNAVVNGYFEVPAGKHPVVLTFDDSSSMHLSFELGPDGQPIVNENGEYVPTPNCAVGIIERFAAEHPDFGRTAHFSTIPQFKFSWPEYAQDEWYDAKIQWLLAHDYEIGNHTSDHGDLAAMTTEDFARNIAEPYIWISDVVDPDDPGFAMGILTLPFGAYPEGGWTGDKLEYLTNGYVWDGYEIQVEGVLLVCCGPSPSPFHAEYSKLWIPRIRGDDPDFERLQEEIDNGWIILYTSDGNPETVTVPWPLPESQWGMLDKEAVTSRGLTLVKYHPDSGKIYAAYNPRDRQAYNCMERVHLSD